MSHARLCPLACTCRCHQDRRSRSYGLRLPWTPREEQALVRYHSRGYTVPQIVAALESDLRVTRTEAAVRQRLLIRGLSLRAGWYSLSDVSRALGYDPDNNRTVKRWIKDGFLPATHHVGTRGSRCHWWHIEPDALLAFVDRHAGVLFPVGKVADPQLRSRAQVAAAANARHRV